MNIVIDTNALWSKAHSRVYSYGEGLVLPWLTELTSVVLGMGCGAGVQVVRLMWDLKRVLIKVDLPNPLSPAG